MRNKDVFQTIIEDYAAARPGYPDVLFCDVVSFSALPQHARILEIGAGPGQATGYFVQNGYDVTALEISEAQTAYLRQKFAAYPNLRCVCSTFEEFDAEDESFDLVLSATAFHWIDPQVGYPKAYHLLKNRGVLAVFWHMASVLEPQTERESAIRAIERKHAPELDDYCTEVEAADMHQKRLQLTQTQHLFGEPVYKEYRWVDSYTTERYCRLMNSYSGFHSIPPAQQTAILEETAAYLNQQGGTIDIPQLVQLYLSKKSSI
jgi:SAM-dependent methyltransferase